MPLDHYPSVAQGQTTVSYIRSNLSEEGRVGRVTETVADALDGAMPMKFGGWCGGAPSKSPTRRPTGKRDATSHAPSAPLATKVHVICAAAAPCATHVRAAEVRIISSFFCAAQAHTHTTQLLTFTLNSRVHAQHRHPRTLSAAGRGRVAAASAAARRAAALPRPSITQWQPASLLRLSYWRLEGGDDTTQIPGRRGRAEHRGLAAVRERRLQIPRAHRGQRQARPDAEELAGQ